MLKKLSLLAVLGLTACGWHFKNNEVLPQDLRTLTFESADQHSDMSRTLRHQLQLNDVELVSATEGVAKLRLVGASSGSKVVSVFKQAREAEKITHVKCTSNRGCTEKRRISVRSFRSPYFL
ncbi:rare lipoprotein B [Actinobacillus pleuropneumoniae]|nr:rare lipoprotein B [Actinobacillus pleuropneumoniae]